ncbi:GNAT family N-acetyltransferase [Octadecabacter sp. R77987]|uniref:GNAT family N-acetyltransferase n=1 Tax=Octadecabacter sp. R77987 TaxID=3093874 RepID=UPI00366EC07A
MTWPAPVTLSGEHVILAPLSQDHASALARAAADLGPLWYTSIPAPDGMTAEIDRRLSLTNMQPFTVMTPDGTPVGMTTYMNTDAVNKRVEIGSTWLGPSVQRTPLNTEAKLLLLGHAFDHLACIAVEFRTHRLNTQSRRAIERLGAQFDGILRAHMVLANGTIRDTAVYSITAPEWPVVKAHLTHQLSR